MKLKIVCCLLFLCSISLLHAQDEAKAKAKLQNLFDYLDVSTKVPPADLDDLSTALAEAEDLSNEMRARARHWLKVHKYLWDITQDPDSAFRQRFIQFGGYPLFSAFMKHELPDYDPNARFTQDNALGRVVTLGRGEQHLILIPPMGFSTSIFDEFIQLNQHRFTMHAVTLPGFGGVPPYARQKKRDLAAMHWFENIENGILALLRKEGIDKAFILGNGIAGNLAIRFALHHPDKVAGVISINGTVNVPMKSAKNPTSPADFEERQSRLDRMFPNAEFVPFPLFQPTASYQSAFSFQTEPIRAMLKENLETADRYAFRIYQEQLKASDLLYELKDLKTPLLSLVSVHDPLSPFIVFSRTPIIEWQKVEQKFSNKPLTLIPIKNSRNLILFDQAEAMTQLIAGFSSNPQGFKRTTQPASHPVNASPSASVSQTFSNTDVAVSYSRPALKGRELMGKLVPYGKVWRAGANEATEISFSRDTWVAGRLVKKGHYSFFIEPAKDKWQIILNSIRHQWGAFNYDKNFDVLRFEVTPEDAAHQERLKYDFENLTDHSVDLTMHWGNTKIAIPMKEQYRVPTPPPAFKAFAWNLILEDTLGDGRSPNSSDGKAFYYYHDTRTDSLWFKFETYNDISVINPAISVSIDTDDDQSTGTPWYGSNRSFMVDLMLSAGPVRQGDGYDGWNGITDAAGISTQNWINIIKNNLTFYFDQENNAYFLGLKRADLGTTSKRIRLIGSVGANSAWNDDIGKDGTYATIELNN